MIRFLPNYILTLSKQHKIHIWDINVNVKELLVSSLLVVFNITVALVLSLNKEIYVYRGSDEKLP